MDITQIFSYNENKVTFRNDKNGIYINATQMAKPFEKKVIEYIRLPATQELIMFLESRESFKVGIFPTLKIEDFKGAKIPPLKIMERRKDTNLVITEKGKYGGTWLHEDLALDFAQWLSLDFKYWCNQKIKELLQNGYVQLNTRSVILDKILLDTPAEWQKTFPDEFFKHIHRIYGHEFDRSKGTFSFIGTIITKYIYNYLLDNLTKDLKLKKKQIGTETLKLHQFLEQNAKKELDTHIIEFVVLLRIASSSVHLDYLFDATFKIKNQLKLLM